MAIIVTAEIGLSGSDNIISTAFRVSVEDGKAAERNINPI